ncbi:MAG: RDD family protein, partial [Thermoanaerobaculia bacterium]|nr:RDD family protein [Thermoanaerobaculia bacterium]
MRPGSVGDRLIALVIDRLFLGAVLLIPLALVGRGWIATGLPLSPLWLNLLGGLALFVLIFVYHFALEKATGTTAGKIVMGLKVVNQGDREAMAAVALRNLLRVVDALFGYLVGFLTALF